jgi:methyltransferase family protein
MTDVNRANWNVWAAAHGQDAYYDRAGLLAGEDSLTYLEWAGVRAAVGDVQDRDVLHVQCHIGFDTITLARHGARVTGVDFSPVALAKAADLADECGVAVTLVEGDSTALPEQLTGRFDLAYATIGIRHHSRPGRPLPPARHRPADARLLHADRRTLIHPGQGSIDVGGTVTISMSSANGGAGLPATANWVR